MPRPGWRSSDARRRLVIDHPKVISYQIVKQSVGIRILPPIDGRGHRWVVPTRDRTTSAVNTCPSPDVRAVSHVGMQAVQDCQIRSRLCGALERNLSSECSWARRRVRQEYVPATGFEVLATGGALCMLGLSPLGDRHSSSCTVCQCCSWLMRGRFVARVSHRDSLPAIVVSRRSM
jgi:hypothetical protein